MSRLAVIEKFNLGNRSFELVCVEPWTSDGFGLIQRARALGADGHVEDYEYIHGNRGFLPDEFQGKYVLVFSEYFLDDFTKRGYRRSCHVAHLYWDRSIGSWRLDWGRPGFGGWNEGRSVLVRQVEFKPDVLTVDDELCLVHLNQRFKNEKEAITALDAAGFVPAGSDRLRDLVERLELHGLKIVAMGTVIEKAPTERFVNAMVCGQAIDGLWTDFGWDAEWRYLATRK